MTTSDKLEKGFEINLAIVKLAVDTEDPEFLSMLVLGEYPLFETEGKELLRILDRIAETNPAYSARVEQIKESAVPLLEHILTDAQADG